MVIKREKANYTIRAVSHSLDILESFTQTDDELGVTELSKRLGLAQEQRVPAACHA